jgi:hypothetical protein
MTAKTIAAVAALAVLSGCTTITDAPSASTEALVKAACVNPGMTSQATIDAAVVELERRGVDCRAIAMQVLMMRAANPLPAPAPLRPYVMQPSPAPAPANVPSAFGTLIGYRSSTTATGLPAYVCQYRVGYNVRETLQPVSQGPCAPTATLY